MFWTIPSTTNYEALQFWPGTGRRVLELPTNKRSGSDEWYSTVLTACRMGNLSEIDYAFLHGCSRNLKHPTSPIISEIKRQRYPWGIEHTWSRGRNTMTSPQIFSFAFFKEMTAGASRAQYASLASGSVSNALPGLGALRRAVERRDPPPS